MKTIRSIFNPATQRYKSSLPVNTKSRVNINPQSNEVAQSVMPTPKSLPVVGTMLSLIAAGGAAKLHLYVHQRHKQLGPIYREKIGPVPAVFVSDAECMRKVFSVEGKHPKHHLPEAWILYNNTYQCKRGLFFMDGEEWLHYRRIMNHVVLRAHTNDITDAVSVVVDDLVDSFKQIKHAHNLEQILYKWSIDVMLSVLLGAEAYSTNKHVLHPLLTELSLVVRNIFLESANLSLMPAKLAMTLNLPVWKRFVVAVERAITLGNSMVDVITPLAAPQDGLLRKLTEAGIEGRYLKMIVTDMILAAGDTTAHSTQWLLFLLATNKAEQDTLRQCIKEEDNINHKIQLPLLKGAIREALRLYPVAPFLTRILPKDEVIGGYQIKAGELILIPLYTSGRNDEYFPNADKFQPDRWLRTEQGYKSVCASYASLPFAMGARSCIGRKIAEIQMSVTTAKILENFKIETNNNKIEMVLKLISAPSEPIALTFDYIGSS